MENIVKVAIILSVAIAAVVGIDSNNFQCTSCSPTNDPVFSNTIPPVALTHIFCGEIKVKKGKEVAQGFHSRYLANGNTPCAKATGKLYQKVENKDKELGGDKDTCMIPQYTFKSEGIEVYNGKDYIKKCTNKGNLNKFFPDAWTPEHVVDVIVRAYHACKDKANGMQLCMKNYKSGTDCEVFSIMIYTNNSKDKIATAFPIDKEDRLSECSCDYNDSGVQKKFKNVKKPHTEL